MPFHRLHILSIMFSVGMMSTMSAQAESLLLHNARIYLSQPNQFASAVFIDDGKIVALGSDKALQKYQTQADEIIDLQGKLVLPGFHDVHTHILEANAPMSGTCIVQFGATPRDSLAHLKVCSSKQIGTEWVLGWGWDIETFISSGQNPRAVLDEAIPNRPAAIMEQTSHAVWANSKALQLLGIDRHSPHPVGGIIAKTKDGKPNGLLIDNAGELAFELALKPSKDLDELHYQGLLNGLDQLAENGITSFVDARAYWTRNYHILYDRANRENLVNAHAILSLWAYPQMDDDNQLKRLKQLYRYDPNALINRNQIKLYVDGITHNTTAIPSHPYKVDSHFETPMGLNYFTEQRLAKYLIELERTGYDFHIHAIGSGGVHQALNAIEKARTANPTLNPRHRITHVEHVERKDIKRFAELGVIADFQFAGAFTEPEIFNEFSHHYLGDNDQVLPLPARILFDASATITLSSDFDVSPLNPFIGIHRIVNRSEGALSLTEAIDAYTINSAYLMRQENHVGSIAVGKQADMIVLSQDIFTIPKHKIKQTKVLMTFFAGNQIY